MRLLLCLLPACRGQPDHAQPAVPGQRSCVGAVAGAVCGAAHPAAGHEWLHCGMAGLAHRAGRRAAGQGTQGYCAPHWVRREAWDGCHRCHKRRGSMTWLLLTTCSSTAVQGMFCRLQRHCLPAPALAFRLRLESRTPPGCLPCTACYRRINNVYKRLGPPQYALEALLGWLRAAYPTSRWAGREVERVAGALHCTCWVGRHVAAVQLRPC